MSSINKEVPPVEDLILEGFRRKYATVFDTKAVLCMSNDKMRALKAQYGKTSLGESDTVEYPYAFLVYSSFADRESGYNKSVTARRGIPNGLIQVDNIRSFAVSFVPKDLVFTVEYVTNSAVQAIRYAKSLEFVQQLSKLSFSISYARTTFDVSSTVDVANISFPTREAEPDNVPEYTVSHTLTVHGYLSQSTLQEEQISHTVAVEAQIPNTPDTTVWSFEQGV